MFAKDVVFVLGIGRSGTSALTRILSLCGCTLPKLVVGASDGNPKGGWEPIESLKLNEDFMRRHGTTAFFDPSMRLQGEITFSEDEKEEYIGKIHTFMTQCPDGKVLLIKDLRITELMEFWLDAARRSQLSVKAIIPLRHPGEVFQSVATAVRNSKLTTSVHSVNAFWTKLCLLAERQSRDMPRVFVEYSNLLTDWRQEVARVAKALSIELKPDEAAINNFLTPDLYRQRLAGPIMETFGYSWTTRIYSILSSAAQDGPIDFTILDEIYDAYCANERTFRIARDEFQANLSHIMKRGESEVTAIWRSGQDFF